MTVIQFIVTYFISWWIVLFMVLPFWVRPPAKPELGHAPSAPEHPQLKRKFMITSVLAFIPTLILMSAMARAEIYHAGSHDCDPLETYNAPADLAAKDLDATMNMHPMAELDQVTMDLDIPSTNYLNPDTHNVDLSRSDLHIGQITVDREGRATLNGKAIAGEYVARSGCIQRPE
jgi:predicted secreted protein